MVLEYDIADEFALLILPGGEAWLGRGNDASIVTANGSAALEFGREIITLLEAKPQDDIAAWYRMNKQGFYPAD